MAGSIEETDDMDEEIHDHERTKVVKKGKAFGWNDFYVVHCPDPQWSQQMEKLLDPPTPWLPLFEFGQKIVDGRIRDVEVSLELQVGKYRWHRVCVLGVIRGLRGIVTCLNSIQFNDILTLVVKDFKSYLPAGAW
jgi:hypothetical protein